jgi:hypothetical protein
MTVIAFPTRRARAPRVAPKSLKPRSRGFPFGYLLAGWAIVSLTLWALIGAAAAYILG